MSTLKVVAVALIVLFSSAFAEENQNRQWRRVRGPDKPAELQTRPVAQNGFPKATEEQAAESEATQKAPADDPPPVRQGDPGGCEEMFIVNRVTGEQVSGSALGDFFQATSYTHITVRNPFMEQVYIHDGMGPVAKNVCRKGMITFVYRNSKLSKKDPESIFFIAILTESNEEYVSYSIPLKRRATNIFYWNIKTPDTVPSVAGFQSEANRVRDDEIYHRKIDCKLYPYECYYGGYGRGRVIGGGYSPGFFNSAPIYRSPTWGQPYFSDPADQAAQERFLPRIGTPGASYYQGGYYVGGGYVVGGGAVRAGGSVRCSSPRCFSGYNNRSGTLFK